MLDSFCPAPWTHTFVDNDGSHRICCRSQADLGTENADHNHPEKKKVRLQFLKGERPESCSYCWKAEQLGGPPSLRQLYVNTCAGKEELAAATKPDGETSFNPISFSLILGNKCNLSCVMCSPLSSTGWYELQDSIQQSRLLSPVGFVRFKREDGKLHLTGQSGNLSWPENEQFMNTLFTAMDTGQPVHVWFSGGEVFLNRGFVPLLERMSNIKDLSVDILSNGTTISQTAKDTIAKFKNIRMNFSVDGVGAVNDYCRYPSKFEVIARNIDGFKHILGKIYITITSFNMFNIVELIQWCESLGYATKFEIAYNNPRHSPLSIPSHIRSRAASKIESFVSSTELKHTNKEDLLGVANMLRQAGEPKLPEFLNYVKLLDSVRGTSFRRTFRELSLALR